ncbi:MAG: hypothetical protein H7039_00685 [Bryobacteraceae bacterium]|nr:hypothetical protein [Bryobacteraceae bacterium]
MMRSFLLSLLLSSSLLAAVSSMGGTWMLNEQRSRFGDNVHPGQVVLTIQHDEPKFKYTGTVNNPPEGYINDFSFDGAIDGKEYVSKQDNRGDRKVTFRRVNNRVVESVTTASEGEIRSRITMSRDGNTLERTMTLRGTDGKTRNWVEIYEKKK